MVYEGDEATALTTYAMVIRACKTRKVDGVLRYEPALLYVEDVVMLVYLLSLDLLDFVCGACGIPLEDFHFRFGGCGCPGSGRLWLILLHTLSGLFGLSILSVISNDISGKLHQTDNIIEVFFHVPNYSLLAITSKIFDFSSVIDELLKNSKFLGKFNNISEITEKNFKKILEEFGLSFSKNTQFEFIYCNISSKFRTIDGSCNNILKPFLGKTNEVFDRLIPATYEDGINTVRKMKNGEDLPNPLLVSRILTSDEYDSKIDAYISHNSLFVNWGQFLSHDLTFTSTFSRSNGFRARCCEGNKHPECIPLAMRFENNYVDSNYCFNFMRSVSALRKKVDNPLESQREQLNKLTAFIDASNVYGTTVEELRFLRDLNGHRAMLKSERTTYEIPIRSGISCKTSVPNCEK
ncbi:eosinophil peroxidase-like [Centruroides vittatus]|uniref:eosinophil peroxidase-like n=1 Tax=Centruroides vittatus TaxID=120091 RepID=UPI0035104EBE